MALMFQRIARNYVKDGYFPTDSDTIERVLSLLKPCKSGRMRIIDPCAGEGVALAECGQHLQDPEADRNVESITVESYGVEYHVDRAHQAKQLLTRCLHGDFQDTLITPRSFGLVWLNPPYGDLVSDNGQTGDGKKSGQKRLEKLFFQLAARLLQYGGVMVLIVPHYVLDHEFRKWIAAGFDRVQVYLAPEKRFKQAVVLGIRKRTTSSDPVYRESLARLEAFAQLDVADKPVLPSREWSDDDCYRVPPSTGEIRFNAARIDEAQLGEEIEKYPGLWPQFSVTMARQLGNAQRRPLMSLSDWHLALALAAGHVSGVVRSNDGGKTYVVKGDTFKDKKHTVQVEEQGNGEFREIRIALDVFVPQIKAIDFTPDSPTFGEVLTIQ